MDPIARLFGSAARLKLLRLFLFNDDQGFSAADAAFRTKTAVAAARKEANALVTMGVLKKRAAKGGTLYVANQRFPHYVALQNFLRATTGVGDADMMGELKRAGSLRLVVLSGMFSGVPDTKVDMLVVGDRLDERSLENAVRRLEAELGRELRYAAFSTEDFRYRLGVYDRLIRDVLEFPNRILLNKLGLKPQ